MAGVGYWLVKIPGQSTGQVQNWPSGHHPTQPAVYLGPTISDAQKWLSTAARELGVQAPKPEPSATSPPDLTAVIGGLGAGIIGGIAAGSGAALGDIGASEAVLGSAGAAGGAEAAGTGAAGGVATSAAKSALGTTAGKIAATTGLAGLLGASGYSELMVRALEALAGGAVMLLGLQALTGQGAQTPAAQVKRVVRRVR